MSRFIIANHGGHTMLYRDLPNNEKQVLSVDNQIMKGINSVIDVNQCIVKFDKERKVLFLQSLVEGSSLIFLDFEKLLELPELKSLPSIIAQLCEKNGYIDLVARRGKNQVVRKTGNAGKMVKTVSALVLTTGIVLSFFTVHGNKMPSMVEASDVTIPQASNYAVADTYTYDSDDTIDSSITFDAVLPVERPYIPDIDVSTVNAETEVLTQQLPPNATVVSDENKDIVVIDNTPETTKDESVDNLDSKDEPVVTVQENDWFEKEPLETNTESVVSYIDNNDINVQENAINHVNNDSISYDNNENAVSVDESINNVEPSYETTNVTGTYDSQNTYNNSQGSGTTVYLEFPDYSETDKAVNCKNNYYGLIEYYAHLYGLDPNLVLGIATQERGVHASTVDPGGAIGLMQIQYNVLINKTFTVYELNEATGNYEPRELTITDDKLVSVDGNIRVGCAILQYNLLESNYNIPVAIQSYNMGPNAVYTVLSRYANDYGMRVEDVLNNPSDMGWINYRNSEGIVGDYSYIENINSWVDNNSYTVIDVRTKQPVSFTFTNYNEQMRGK